MTPEQKNKSRYSRLNVFILEQYLYLRNPDNRVNRFEAEVFLYIMRTAKREKINLKKNLSLYYGTEKAVQRYSRNNALYKDANYR